MKTFDIAVAYLDSLDLRKLDLFVEREDPNIVEQLKERMQDFENDIRNKRGNGYYRQMTFACAVFHVAFKQQGQKSFFDVACEIVRENKKFGWFGLRNIPKYGNSAYPLVMIEKWNEYRKSLNPQPVILADNSEVALEFFMTAYHYVINFVS
ncbi:MAG TPA: hypothetical protein PK289_01225 [Bacteroidia bacterium]|nr:hypothetical protein [Bacteroidia bacterium]